MKKGYKFTLESRKKMSDSHKGKRHSEEHIEKIRKAMIGKKWSKKQKLNISGDNHYRWKKEKTYRGIHFWINKWGIKPKKCSKCGKKKNRMGWANKDHKYRMVLEYYMFLCPKCHGEYDTINNLRKHK